MQCRQMTHALDTACAHDLIAQCLWGIKPDPSASNVFDEDTILGVALKVLHSSQPIRLCLNGIAKLSARPQRFFHLVEALMLSLDRDPDIASLLLL